MPATGGRRGRIEGDVRHPAIGASGEIAGRVARVEQLEPESRCECPPSRRRFAHEDPSSARTARDERQQEPDRPGAHDHHDLALPDRCAADGVDRDGERLGEHCQIGVDPGRDPVDPVRIDRNAAREPAVDIDADEPELGAHVCLPHAAGDA